MGAQRAAWLQAARAELAEVTGKHFAQELIDLAKCFEHVPLHLLVRFAIKHGYSLWVLRLSIATYRCERTIRIEGALSRTIVANRGIVAGSVFWRSFMTIEGPSLNRFGRATSDSAALLFRSGPMHFAPRLPKTAPVLVSFQNLRLANATNLNAFCIASPTKLNALQVSRSALFAALFILSTTTKLLWSLILIPVSTKNCA